MNFNPIKKYLNKNNTSVVNFVFLLYFIFLIAFVSVYILILHKNPVFFLNDDGYYTIGRDYYNGEITLFHQFRSPGIILFYSWFNLLPDPFHPFLRLIFTLALTYASLFFSSKIFENILTKKQMLVGFLISVFNPVFIHFTIKSTPEIFLLFFLTLIIFYYNKYIKEFKLKYLIFVILFVIVAMSFKPVFFLISFFLLIHSIFIKKFKKLFVQLAVFSLISIFAFFASSILTKPVSNEINYIFVESVVVPSFLPEAIMKTKELNLGTKGEYLNEKPDKSNYLICMENYNSYLSDYKQRSANHSEFLIILDFVKNNFVKFSLVKLFSPITFISLSSSTVETIMNFFLNSILITISLVSIKKIYKENRNEIIVILCVILGYSFVFFLSACYIRYSLPALFLLYPFSGIYISGKLDKNN